MIHFYYLSIIVTLLMLLIINFYKLVTISTELSTMKADKQPKLLEEAFQDAMFIYYRKCYGNYPINGDMLINHNGKDYCYINNKWYTT